MPAGESTHHTDLADVCKRVRCKLSLGQLYGTTCFSQYILDILSRECTQMTAWEAICSFLDHVILKDSKEAGVLTGAWSLQTSL